jgi:DNA (cytosine-5)-methyltransferase 1
MPTREELIASCKARGIKGYTGKRKEELIALLGSAPQVQVQVQVQPEAKFTFIDLFCGIGGFHQALASIGGRCLLACDIDPKCREQYARNYGLTPHDDVTTLDTAKIPDFDVLCGGFPCQAFSHAGKQGGFEDTRGTLFNDIVRILRAKQPKYFLLENVKNLVSHDGGKTWATIYKSLTDAGYVTYEQPIVMNPLHFGVPQHRERVIIIGIRGPGPLPPPPTLSLQPTNIATILEADAPPETHLNSDDIALLEHWNTFVQHFKSAGIKLPTYPIWTEEWDQDYDIEGIVAWKANFLERNRAFYTVHRAFLAPWLTAARGLKGFSGARSKFEWQCGAFQADDSLWTLLFQFRPSGIRVKRANYSPALVAMAQIVYVGSKKRKLSPREVARLQSFPDSYLLPASASAAYKQFGNAVNVEVIKQAAIHMFSAGGGA